MSTQPAPVVILGQHQLALHSDGGIGGGRIRTRQSLLQVLWTGKGGGLSYGQGTRRRSRPHETEPLASPAARQGGRGGVPGVPQWSTIFERQCLLQALRTETRNSCGHATLSRFVQISRTTGSLPTPPLCPSPTLILVTAASFSTWYPRSSTSCSSALRRRAASSPPLSCTGLSSPAAPSLA